MRSQTVFVTFVAVVVVSLGLLNSAVAARTNNMPAGFFGRLFGTSKVSSWSDDTGGVTCAGCTIIVGLVEQMAELHNHTVDKAMAKFCSYLPTELHAACKHAIDIYGAKVVALLEQKETPDVVCHAISLCKTSGRDMCHLFPKPSVGLDSRLVRAREQALQIAQLHGRDVLSTLINSGASPDFCKWPGVDRICKIVDHWTTDFLPEEDLDGDGFSVIETDRGSSWRGKDCNDLDSGVYPGRKPSDGDATVDSNCNGISGVDSESGKPYEELWCNGTEQIGALLLGDSIGAHFHIPTDWLNVTELNEKSFEHLFFILKNEMDWPQLSMDTGHFNASPRWAQDIHGPTDSVYLRLRNINRCNHRDYQNMGVNGARSVDMPDIVAKALRRREHRDQPALIILELVGNDVCSSHPGTSDLTPPEDYYTAQLKSLRYIDAQVPKGSHVFTVGLADARFSYNTLHNRIHPLGALRGDVTYADWYNYLNCLGVSPCWGWLNSNETWRNRTTAWAESLNKQLQKLVETEKFNNIDLLYSVVDIQTIAEMWEAEGGQAWQLMEPADGFHVSQLGNAIGTSLVWKILEAQKPDWLPPANPHNEEIVRKFGNQGGY